MLKKILEKKMKGPEKILLAAEQVFAAKGAEGATIDEIVKAAGINKALLYYHFKNKDEILKALIHKNMDEIVQVMPVFIQVADGSIEDILRHSVTSMFEFFSQRKKILNILIIEMLRLGSQDTSIFEIFQPISDMFFNRIQEKGLITIKKPEFLLRQFFLNMMPFIMFLTLGDQWARFNNQDIDATNAKFQEFFIQTLISHIIGATA